MTRFAHSLVCPLILCLFLRSHTDLAFIVLFFLESVHKLVHSLARSCFVLFLIWSCPIQVNDMLSQHVHRYTCRCAKEAIKLIEGQDECDAMKLRGDDASTDLGMARFDETGYVGQLGAIFSLFVIVNVFSLGSCVTLHRLYV